MKGRILWLFAFLALGVLLVGNHCGRLPALPLSDKSGSKEILTADVENVVRAITNHFAGNHYSGMHLYHSSELEGYLIPDASPTNGFILFPLDGPITNIRLRNRKRVPYIPYFQISYSGLNESNTEVTVTTVKCDVIDGREIGLHAGWANHYRPVPAVKQEELNVLSAIKEQLNSLPRP